MNTEKGQFNQKIDKKYIGMVEDSKKESDHFFEHIAETIIAKFFHVFPTEAERLNLYIEHWQKTQPRQKGNIKPSNHRIGKAYVRMVKVDAASTDQTIECVIETAIVKFFQFFGTREEREKIYDEHLRIKKIKQKLTAMPSE